MPIWAYNMSPLLLAVIMIVAIEALSLIGLFLARKFLLPRLHYGEGVNDAISGTVQAIGVFYGITVGLIAVGVWNTTSNSSDLVSREAASIGALYRDVSGYPTPIREQLQAGLRQYTVVIIEQIWPAQKEARTLDVGTRTLDDFQGVLFSFEPSTPGQTALHAESLRAYNTLIEYRRQRIEAVNSGLSGIMWSVIWIGAAISIAVAYFYRIDDPKLHAILVGLMAGFLAMVLFMIVINDKPFFGHVHISSEPYKLILHGLIDTSQ